MSPTLVLLARHGESDWNVAARFQGHSDRPLTERGQRQAEELAERLARVSLEAVYSSDLRRAWETAEPIARRHELEVHRLPELREVDVGSWAGLTRADAERRFRDGYRRWRAGGTGWEDGETYEEMGKRVIETVRSVAASHPGGPILVVSHGGALRALHAEALGVDMAALRRKHPVTPNADISAVSVDAGGRLSEPPGSI